MSFLNQTYIKTFLVAFLVLMSPSLSSPQRQLPQQPAEKARVKPADVQKIKADIARWRNAKASYLANIEVVGRRPSHKSLSDRARLNVNETERTLAELETLITKERVDRNQLVALKTKLGGLLKDGRSITPGWLVRSQVTLSIVDPGDCNTTHAGYYTTAQCRYCMNRPKDDCMCRTSNGPCTCYCDATCNCGDLSIFDDPGTRNAAASCHAYCVADKHGQQLFNIIAGLLKTMNEMTTALSRIPP